MSQWRAVAEDLERDFGIKTFVDHDEDGYTIIFRLKEPEILANGFKIKEEAQFVRMKHDVYNIVWRKYRSEQIKVERGR